MSDTPVTDFDNPPPLDYPALFTWRVVGEGGRALREHARRSVEAVLGAVADDAISERPSASGNFLSVRVTCLLKSEDERRAIYERLRASPLVRLVL